MQLPNEGNSASNTIEQALQFSEEDRLSLEYAISPEFHRLIDERRNQVAIPWEDARRQFELDT